MTWASLVGVTAMMILLGSPLDAASRSGAAGVREHTVPILVAMPDHSPVAPEPRFVRDAQRALRELGYAPGPLDGIIGARTRAALTRYQQAQRLPSTGELDAETMARLDIYLRVLRTTEERAAESQGGLSGRLRATATPR